MKSRLTFLLIVAALTLTACSFSLAADVTPPPDYVSPTPMPTLGALYPASAPDPQSGAAIFADNCAACHGTSGLGDGPQSMQLPVTVPGIGLPEVARAASPAAWFKIVTQGNLDRFMPPFVGALTDQQRWDVVFYALSLHTTPAQLSRGESLIKANCADCAGKFSDQTKMAALSEQDLVAIIKNGQGDIPAFGKDLADDDAYAVASYLRSLTFAAPAPLAAASTPAAPSSQTPGSVGPEVTPLTASGGTATAGTGTVTGSLVIPAGVQSGGLTVTLHGFDHGADQTSGPQEVLTLSTVVDSNGAYSFENVAMPVNRIFLAEVEYSGIKYRSGFQAVVANSTQIALPPLKLYEASSDFSQLKLEQVHIYTDFATAVTVQVLEIFAFTNASDHSVVISTDGTTIPFIQLPEGAQNQGYEAGQDSAPFVSADKGLAVVPSDKPYSIIAFFNLPYDKKLEIKQPLAIDAPSILLLVPDGMKVEGQKLASKGLQVIQNNNYQEFLASGLMAGETLSFSISGRPRTSSATGLDAHQALLIAGAVLGIALIGGGVFLYLRDRKRAQAEPVEAEFDSADDVMDAILALDDLHRAGKISDEAYQKRRDELKQSLRRVA
jgi:mono/diheme cytochrome c family protein